jgi:hypothetical protein
MPYIEPYRRTVLDDVRAGGAGYACEKAGELTYVIYKAMLGYVARHGHRFATFASIAGALLLGVLEFYRRVVAPYEDRKRAVHGDVE